MRVEVDASRDGWSEVRPAASGGSSGPSALVGVVAGAAVVALLVWRGHWPAAVLLAIVVAALTVGRRLSPAFDRALAKGLGRFGHLVGIVLSWIALGLTMLFVVFPVWAVSRIARWDTLEPEPRHGLWADHRSRPWRRRPDRGFTDDRRDLPPRTRVRGALTAAVPIVLLGLVLFTFRDEALIVLGKITPGHLVFGDDEPSPTAAPPPTTPSGSATEGIPQPTGDPPDGYPRNTALSYDDAPWKDEYFREFFPVVFAYDPYLTVRAADRQEQYLNVHERVRQSYEPQEAATDPAALDVWFFGSSALFGQGQRDDHTIPSEVARAAEQDGIPIHVENFGVPSYWAWQDSLLLAQMLSERPHPDLIITYEGYNDVANTMPAGSPEQVSTGFADQIRQVLLDAGARFAGASNSAVDTMPRTSVWSPQNAATIYGRAATLSRQLAEVNAIPIAQFLQPSLWSRDLAVDDATLANIGADREYHDSYATGWNQARVLMARHGIVDLGDVLDDTNQLIYSDDVHMNELGAHIVADALYQHVRPQLEELHAAKAAAAP